jgi:hypothetical protein
VFTLLLFLLAVLSVHFEQTFNTLGRLTLLQVEQSVLLDPQQEGGFAIDVLLQIFAILLLSFDFELQVFEFEEFPFMNMLELTDFLGFPFDELVESLVLFNDAGQLLAGLGHFGVELDLGDLQLVGDLGFHCQLLPLGRYCGL